MDKVKNDRYFPDKLHTDLHFITEHMKDIGEKEFELNEVLQDSMMFRLIQISENARKLTESFRENHAEIPWSDVYGLRNRIVHLRSSGSAYHL